MKVKPRFGDLYTAPTNVFPYHVHNIWLTCNEDDARRRIGLNGEIFIWLSDAYGSRERSMGATHDGQIMECAFNRLMRVA